MDAAAQLDLLLCAQQRDLADLLEVVLHGVVQQLIHGGLQVGGVLLCLFLFAVVADAQLIAVGLGILHLGNDAVHVQTGILFRFVVQNLDAALLQQGVEGLHIHPALGGQRLGLLCAQGAFAFRQQFLQSHAHFALSFSPWAVSRSK